MKNTQKWIAGLAVAGLIFVSGCKKSEVKVENQSEANAYVAQSIKDWNKSEVNSLLKFVPSDVSAVFATTRNFDMNAPQYKGLLELSQKILNLNALSEAADGDADLVAFYNAKYMKDVESILRDYSKMASKFGLDPDGRTDSVLFVDGKNVVIKSTLSSGDKFRAKLTEWIEDAQELMPKNGSVVLTQKELVSDGEKWTVYGLSIKGIIPDEPATEYRLGIHVGEHMLTMVVDPDASVSQYLKTAKTSLELKALGNFDKNSMGIGYVNIPKVTSQIVNNETFKAVYQEIFHELPEQGCLEDAVEIATAFPKVTYDVRFDKERELSVTSTLSIANKDIVKKIQGLEVEHIDLFSKNPLIGLKIGLNTPKAIALGQELIGLFTSKSFKCAGLNSQKFSLPMLYGLFTNDSTTKLVAGNITLFNFALYDIDKSLFNPETEDNVPSVYDLALNIGGPKIADAMPELIQKFWRVNATEILQKLGDKNTLGTADLQAKDGKYKFVTYYTDTDFVLASEQNAVDKLAVSPKINDHQFIEFTMSGKFLNLMSDSMNDSVKSLVNSYEDVSYVISVGANDQGLTGAITYRY